MSYDDPHGYRLPGSTMLPGLARTLERGGWDLWRTEAARALGRVCLASLAEGEDATYARLSHNQVGRSDLTVTASVDAPLMCRVAEFIDVAHEVMVRRTSLPIAPSIDLRCRAQFFDDPADEDQEGWVYVLFATQHARLVEAFERIQDIEPFPLTPSTAAGPVALAGEGGDLAAKTWERLLAPYSRSQPLSVSAPQPETLFDLIEAVSPGSDTPERVTGGRLTPHAVLDQILQMDSGHDWLEMRDRLLGPWAVAVRQRPEPHEP